MTTSPTQIDANQNTNRLSHVDPVVVIDPEQDDLGYFNPIVVIDPERDDLGYFDPIYLNPNPELLTDEQPVRLITAGLGIEAAGNRKLIDQVQEQIQIKGVVSYLQSLIDQGVVADLAGGDSLEALIGTLHRNVTGIDPTNEFLGWALEATQDWSIPDVILYAADSVQIAALVGQTIQESADGIDSGNVFSG